MKDSPFIGRELEMERLKGLLNKKSASLVVVLIHVNGVEDAVFDRDYFDKVVDFGQLLN